MACNKFALIYGLCCNLFMLFTFKIMSQKMLHLKGETYWKNAADSVDFWQMLLWSSFQVSGALECLINNCLRQRAIWKSLYSTSTAGFYFHHLLFLLLTLLKLFQVYAFENVLDTIIIIDNLHFCNIMIAAKICWSHMFNEWCMFYIFMIDLLHWKGCEYHSCFLYLDDSLKVTYICKTYFDFRNIDQFLKTQNNLVMPEPNFQESA